MYLFQFKYIEIQKKKSLSFRKFICKKERKLFEKKTVYAFVFLEWYTKSKYLKILNI